MYDDIYYIKKYFDDNIDDLKGKCSRYSME